MPEKRYNKSLAKSRRIIELTRRPTLAVAFVAMVFLAVAFIWNDWALTTGIGIIGYVIFLGMWSLDRQHQAKPIRDEQADYTGRESKVLNDSWDVHLNAKDRQWKGGIAPLIAAKQNFLDLNGDANPDRELVNPFSDVAMIAAGLAHEIGTPLNVVRINAQYLSRRFREESTERTHLQKIVSQTNRIASLIRDLLDLAREETGSCGEFDLRQTLTSCIARTRERFPILEWITELEVQEAPLMGYARRMDHAVMNILENAGQAMEGHGVLGIRLQHVRIDDRDYYRILISDTGTGIDPKIKHKILQPFFTTKSSGEGPGLGLTLADRVVRQHRGKIEIHSSKGQGALLEILIPFDLVNVERVEEVASA